MNLVLTTIVELGAALLCIGLAGHIVIRLFDAQRESGRKED